MIIGPAWWQFSRCESSDAQRSAGASESSMRLWDGRVPLPLDSALAGRHSAASSAKQRCSATRPICHFCFEKSCDYIPRAHAYF